MERTINHLTDFDFRGKRVLFRPDINSPIDPLSKQIVNENRLQKSAPTLKHMLEGGAKVAVIAHQGDTQDYQNLIPMREHAEKLAALTGCPVSYIDDVCGPAALDAVRALAPAQAIVLGNLRYLGEELSTFSNFVKLTPEQMKEVWLVRQLAPLFDLYVNDAFSAAHRDAPSMVAFPALMPSAAGLQFASEYEALASVSRNAAHPSVFVLGGAKVSDAFGMMEPVLEKGTADTILTTGVTGILMLIASGHTFGEPQMQFLRDRDMMQYVTLAEKYLAAYPGRIEMPCDLAYAKEGTRAECSVSALPQDALFQDIGKETMKRYHAILQGAKTIFANGPAGVYEDALFAEGTRQVWSSIASSAGYSVIGGGDTVSSATRFIDLAQISYVCTAGGAMVRFMSGKKLPLIAAMEDSFRRCPASSLT